MQVSHLLDDIEDFSNFHYFAYMKKYTVSLF